jgi:hypothetical protein
MTMDPKDRKPDMNPGHHWEQDLESVRSALPGLESAEPPDLLDQAVLNTARRELASSRRKPIRWVGAFATAAVVVLALSIVVQQNQNTLDPRSGNGIKLDAASPIEAESPAKTAMKQVGKESSYHREDEPDLAESRVQSNDENVDMPVALSRNKDREEDPRSEVLPDSFRIESSLLEKAEDVSEEIALTPDAWIAYMIELQKAERLEELKVELEEFRKAYPDHPLPSELRD